MFREIARVSGVMAAPRRHCQAVRLLPPASYHHQPAQTQQTNHRRFRDGTAALAVMLAEDVDVQGPLLLSVSSVLLQPIQRPLGSV